jgi:hypothetical protein
MAVRVRIEFNRRWPMMGEMRDRGDILLDGISPIPATAEKILNAIRMNAVDVIVTEETGKPSKLKAGKK